MKDITIEESDTGGFDAVYTSDLGASGKDGYSQPTPTVRELAKILQAIPEKFQDLPVSRYGDEGIYGISFSLHYDREGVEYWTNHVTLW